MRILKIVTLIFILSVFVAAQETILKGTIYDLTNQPIPNVKIKIQNQKNESFQIKADLNGQYAVGLKEGIYSFEFQVDGFKISRFENYRIRQTELLKFDVTLYISEPTNCPLPDNNEVMSPNKNF